MKHSAGGIQAAAIALAGVIAAGGLAGCSGDPIEDGGRTGTGSGTGTPTVAPGMGNTPNATVPPGGVLPGTGSPGSGVPVGGAIAPPPKTCAEGLANTSPVTPTVWLVIDGSGSMAEDFGGSTRWESLRSALMAPDGVVSSLQQFVKFGMVIYSGGAQTTPACTGGTVNFACGCYTGSEAACCSAACGGTPPMPTGTCAELISVDPVLSNFSALDTKYPRDQVGGWTPTDRALEHVVTNLPVLNGPNLPDVKKDPIYVILATDGAPNDQCSPGMGGGGGVGSGFQSEVATRVVNTVTAGVQKGMHMFVISLAGMDAQLRTHLEQVAQIGSPGQKPFEPSTKNDLVAALQQIIGGATCQVKLNGVVSMGQECQGQVAVNGAPLPCNSDNGWRLTDERTVQLTGTACTSFLGTASQVRAVFPCEVFRPD